MRVKEYKFLSIILLLAIIAIGAMYFVNENQLTQSVSFSSSGNEIKKSEKYNEDRAILRIGQKPVLRRIPASTVDGEGDGIGKSENVLSQNQMFEKTCEVSKKRSVRLFLGIGYNYVDYQEHFSWVDVRYRDLDGPSLHIGAEFQITDNWDVNGTFKDTPLKFHSTDPTYDDIDSHWKTLALQMQYNHKPNDYSENVNHLSLSSIFGLQVHETPMVIFNSGTGQPQIVDLQLVNASLGFKAKYLFSPKIEGEILMRFQYPLTYSAGSFADTEVKPILFYDGSLGVNTRITERSLLGLFWFGQSLNMDVDITSPSSNVKGSHNVFFSNMELRYTYEF